MRLRFTSTWGERSRAIVSRHLLLAHLPVAVKQTGGLWVELARGQPPLAPFLTAGLPLEGPPLISTPNQPRLPAGGLVEKPDQLAGRTNQGRRVVL